MQSIRVSHDERPSWKAYAVVTVCLVSGPWIFFQWNRNWTRVPAGADGWAPNAAIAARTESLIAMRVAGAPITDVLIIKYAAAEKSLWGTPVRLERVGVRAMSGPDAFWVSQLGTQPVFVALGESGPRPQGLQAEMAVNVTGTVQPAPEREQARERWPGLSQDQLAQLESDRVYVQADSVEVVGRY